MFQEELEEDSFGKNPPLQYAKHYITRDTAIKQSTQSDLMELVVSLTLSIISLWTPTLSQWYTLQ